MEANEGVVTEERLQQSRMQAGLDYILLRRWNVQPQRPEASGAERVVLFRGQWTRFKFSSSSGKLGHVRHSLKTNRKHWTHLLKERHK